MQVWMPSTHVWPNLSSPSFPHLLNHAPSGAQQLRLPVFLFAPHLGQALEGVFGAVSIAGGVSVDVFETLTMLVALSTRRILYSMALTSASLDSFDPCVFKGPVAHVAATIEPATTGGTTTKFAGFFLNAALRANIIVRRRNCRRIDCRRVGRSNARCC